MPLRAQYSSSSLATPLTPTAPRVLPRAPFMRIPPWNGAILPPVMFTIDVIWQNLAGSPLAVYLSPNCLDEHFYSNTGESQGVWGIWNRLGDAAVYSFGDEHIAWLIFHDDGDWRELVSLDAVYHSRRNFVSLFLWKVFHIFKFWKFKSRMRLSQHLHAFQFFFFSAIAI